MKRYIKLLPLVCLFATCQLYGMQTDEIKETTASNHRLSGAEILNIYKALLQNRKAWGTATQISDYADKTMIELQYANGIKEIMLIHKDWSQQQYTYGSLPTLMIRTKFNANTQQLIPYIFCLGGFHLHKIEYTDLALLGSTESDRAYLKEWDEERERNEKMANPNFFGLIEQRLPNEEKASENSHDPLNDVVIYDEALKQKYKTAIIDQLYPMPSKLIAIIISYMFPLCQLKGERIAAIGDKALHVAKSSHNQIAALDITSPRDTITIHNSENGALEREFTADPRYYIWDFVYLANDKLLLSLGSKSSGNHKTALYNGTTGQLLNESPNSEETTRLVKLTKNIFAIATPWPSNKIQIWNTAKNILKQKRTIITDFISGIEQIITLPHQQIAVTGNYKPKIDLYNWKTGQLEHTMHTRYCPSMVRLAGSILISYESNGQKNNRLDLWDCSTGQCLKSFSDKYIARVVTLPSRLLLITRYGTPATISDPRNGNTIKQLTTLKDLDTEILPLSNNRFVTYGVGSNVQLWR